MSNKSSENYLDNLLDSITGVDLGGRRIIKQDIASEDRPGLALESDDDFLKAFEEELESDSYRDYFAEFEKELEEEQKRQLELQTDTSRIPDDIGAIIKGLEDDAQRATEIPDMPMADISSPQEMMDEEVVEISPEEALQESGEVDTLDMLDVDTLGKLGGELPLSEIGEPDLSGSGDDDLMDMLSMSDEFGDIGELLSGDGDSTVGEIDEFARFAQEQMDEQERASSVDENSIDEISVDGADIVGKKKKQRGRHKKNKAEKVQSEEGVSFKERFKKLLFGEDEPENSQNIPDKISTIADELAGENLDILSELRAELDSVPSEATDKKKGKKDKKKNPKKAKKPDKPKKAPKSKKPPKPKKEKKPKEKDNTPPLPKGPVILIFFMVGSLTFLVLLGTKLLNYSSAVSQAKSAYKAESYTEAFKLLQGEDIAAKDQVFYDKLKILATIDSEYDAYLLFRSYGDEPAAMDSLICSAGRYNINLENAMAFDQEEAIEEQYNKNNDDFIEKYKSLRTKIEEELVNYYGISFDEAIEIYSQRNRTEYSVILLRKIKELGLE